MKEHWKDILLDWLVPKKWYSNREVAGGNREIEYKYVKWERKWSFTAKTCYISSEKIPKFSWAYKGNLCGCGTCNPNKSCIWMSEQNFLIEKLKGNIK